MGRYPIRSYYHYFASTLASAANIPSAILGNVWFAMTARPFSPMLVQEDRRAVAVLIVRIVASRSPGGTAHPVPFPATRSGTQPQLSLTITGIPQLIASLTTNPHVSSGVSDRRQRISPKALKKGSLILNSVGRENEQITPPGVRFNRNG